MAECSKAAKSIIITRREGLPGPHTYADSSPKTSDMLVWWSEEKCVLGQIAVF